jgi:uncharacterized protein (DUF2147 family)
MIFEIIKKLKTFILLFLVFVSENALTTSNFIHGVYETELGKDEDGYLHVEFKECLNSNGLFCGYIYRAFEYPSNEIDEKYEHLDKIMVWDIKKNKNIFIGKIWAPDDNKVYKVKISMNNENQIKVKGCIMIFCRTQYWNLVE